MRFCSFSMAVLIISRTMGHRYFVRSSPLLNGVSDVFPLRISPIFRWSIDRQGYLYFSSSFCDRTVLPVCDAPVIKMIMVSLLLSFQFVANPVLHRFFLRNSIFLIRFYFSFMRFQSWCTQIVPKMKFCQKLRRVTTF